jgi:hypothetical protein
LQRLRLLTQQLPKICFEEFNAYPITRATVSWRNKSVAPEFLDLSQCGLMIPLYGDPLDCIDKRVSRKLVAERYGGDGLGTNGGGVRCGLLEDVPIKGVGQNQLVGLTNSDYWHTYGGANLAEGVLEALWGEICSAALPYGAARVHGLILTGTNVRLRYPRSNGPTTAPRVLIVRQQVLRPAHFMRSVFYRQQELGGRLSTIDTLRTRQALLMLQASLGELKGPAKSGSKGGEYLISCGLETFVSRHAHQIATARALRLMHGSLTASNVALDGRWLDFTSISAVSDYGRVILPRGAPDFMHEEQIFVSALFDLGFYIDKYLPQCRQEFYERGGAGQWLVNLFSEIFSSRCEIEFLKLMGFQEHALLAIDPPTRKRMYSAIIDIVRVGNLSPFTILSSDDNDYVPTMPEVMGSYHLNSIMCALATAANPAQADAALTSKLLTDASLRQTLVGRYFEMISASLMPYPEGRRERKRLFFALNSIRLNSGLKHLYRTNLYPAIDAAIESGLTDFTQFIDTRVTLAKRHWGSLECDVVPIVAGTPEEQIGYTVERGFQASGHPISWAEALIGFDQLLGNDVAAQNLRCQCERVF